MDINPQEDTNISYTENQVEKTGEEKEFIKLYGRIDLATGTLVNMTDGVIRDYKISDVEKIYNHKKYHIIYKTTNIVNNKIYIGYHGTDEIEDGYLGSGLDLKKAFKKYGKNNFKREILFIFDNAIEAYKKEREIVDEAFVARKDTYNLSLGGLRDGQRRIASHGDYKKIVNTSNGIVYPNMKAAKIAMNTNYIVRECGNPNSVVEFEDPKEQKKAELAYLNFLKNKEVLAESCSKRFKGVPLSEERRKKHSESQKGKKRLNPQNKDPEKIRKMAEKHRGMKRSEESKKKMSDAKKGMIAKNRKLSDDAVRKIREDYKNNVEVNLISEFGITLVYKSAFCKEYGKKYNVSTPCIRDVISNRTYTDVK